MSPRYAQCILIEMYKENVPKLDAEHSLVQRAQIAVFAMVPRVQFYDRIRRTFAEHDIKMLTVPLDLWFTQAFESDKTGFHEIFIEKDPLFAQPPCLIVYADIGSKALVELVFDGHCQVKNLLTWYIETRNDTGALGLLDEDNLDTIEELYADSRCRVLTPLSHCPVLRKDYVRDREMKALYVRTYSGKKVIKLLENRGSSLVREDARDVELVFGAVDLDRTDLLVTLLQWGAGVHYRSRADLMHLEPSQSGDVVWDALLRSVTRGSLRCFQFLTKLDDSRSRNVDLSIFRRASYHCAPTNTAILREALNSRGLNLDFILDREFRYKTLELGDQIAADLIKFIVSQHVEVVTAADLNVNKSLAQKARLCLSAGKALNQLLERLESPPLEELSDQVALLKDRRMGISGVSLYDFLNAGVPEIVRFLRDSGCLHDLKMYRDWNGFEEVFPTYAFIVEWKVLKALYRRELIQKGVKLLSFLFKRYSRHFPNEIKEKILDHLSNLDLLVFVSIYKLPDSNPHFN